MNRRYNRMLGLIWSGGTKRNISPQWIARSNKLLRLSSKNAFCARTRTTSAWIARFSINAVQICPPKKTKLLVHFISARHLATQISQRQPRRRGRSRSLPDIGTCALTLRPPNPPASARHQSKSHRTEASQPRSDQITQHRAGKEEMGLGSPREEPPARRAPPPPPPAAPPAVPWEGAAAQVAVDDPRRAVWYTGCVAMVVVGFCCWLGRSRRERDRERESAGGRQIRRKRRDPSSPLFAAPPFPSRCRLFPQWGESGQWGETKAEREKGGRISAVGREGGSCWTNWTAFPLSATATESLEDWLSKARRMHIFDSKDWWIATVRLMIDRSQAARGRGRIQRKRFCVPGTRTNGQSGKQLLLNRM